MPTIICSYCQYVGQGKDHYACIEDVISHEESCSHRENIDPDYEAMMADLASP